MATTTWQMSGRESYETCSCGFVLSVPAGADGGTPHAGSCTFAMAFQIERGTVRAVSLDGLGFIVLGLTPEAMGHGDWSVGLITDDGPAPNSARQSPPSPAERRAGRWRRCSGLIGTFLGVGVGGDRFSAAA